MTDAFPMHDTFPMDQAYSTKAAERGFGRDRALQIFEEWRSYWTERGEPKTPRGWLACWNNNLIRKAKSAAVNNGNGKNRFERKPDANTITPGPRMVWVGGMGYGFLQILPLMHRRAGGDRLTPEEQMALTLWDRGDRAGGP